MIKKRTLENLILFGFIISLTFLFYVYIRTYSGIQLKPWLKSMSNNEVYVRTYPHAVIDQLWLSYRDKIQKDGRTIDRSRNYLSTSEGQSYSLLRAVWMDDKETFDRVLKWTLNNLQKRPNDELFAWKWGQRSDGKWDILEDEGGMNTASDADQDIALALIFAHKRWKQDHYLEHAQEILNEIWRVEVLELNGKYYLLAGNWAKEETYPTINPSYLSFAAYPIFAEVNPENPWLKLRDDSYEVLEQATQYSLDQNSSANIPPDWVSLDKATGKVIASVHKDKETHFADDAFRVIWRVALDYRWHDNPRALDYLKSLDFLKNEWETREKIYSNYFHDGKVKYNYESNSLYGGIIPYFRVVHPDLAEDVYFSKLISLYNPDIEDFKEDIGYYAQNWVWFGIAFYEGKLINLWEY